MRYQLILHHFAWVALVVLGIVLLSPLSGVVLDIFGVMFVLLAGAGWAVFIILAARVGERIGIQGLTGVARVVAAAIGITVSGGSSRP